MAIYIYNENDHPSKYQGIRVVRSVNNVLHQKYFTFRVNGEYVSLEKELEMYKKAERLDKKWEKLQKNFKKTPAHYTKPIRRKVSPMNTGVRGINAYYTVSRKCRNNKFIRYYKPIFVLQIMREGKLHSRNYAVGKHGITEAWRLTVTFYAKVTGIEVKELIALQPDKAIFTKVAQYLKKIGHIIPKKEIP
jgi:membrane-bound lytic murein transglycosylase